jgi:hypothetical protein
MTKDQFKSRAFKHSMLYDYVCPRTGERVSCSLIAVNFDGGTMKLWQLPQNENQVDNAEEFWCSYEYLELPLVRLKSVL